MNGRSLRVRVGSRELVIGNLDKVLYPGDGLTKGDLIEYYFAVARYLLPHLRDRPLSLLRYPDGIGAPGFYQKDAPPSTPSWVETVPVTSGDQKVIRYVVCNDPATLVWMGNQAVIEIHPWPARKDRLRTPDYLVFDLDPAEGATWEDVKAVARAIRSLLEELRLVGFPKVSGATGLHIYVPVKRVYDPTHIVSFAKRAAEIIQAAMPDRVTLRRPVKERRGKVYIDYLQNSPGQTMVAAYSPRARKGAPVSMPVSWEELDDVVPDQWSIRTAPRRLAEVGDYFQDLLAHKQDLVPWLVR